MTSVGILCHATLGGSVRIATQLAGELSTRGHRVTLFARTRPVFSLPDEVELRTIGHAPRSARDRLEINVDRAEFEALTGLIVDAVRGGVEVLHFHYGLPFAAVAREVRSRTAGASPSIIGTLHGTDVSMHGVRGKMQRGLRRDLMSADVLTTVSMSHAALIRRHLRMNPIVIPNFVDLAVFSPSREVRATRPRVIHMSNFRPVKNTLCVARAFARFYAVMDAELWLVGDGETLADTLRELRRGGVPDSAVQCLGIVDEPAQVLAQADAVLLASHQESFSLAALEAMASGVPVVGTRVGGLPELIDGRSCGILVGADDDHALAEALLSAWHQREVFRSGAIRRAADFSLESIVSHYERLYGTLLASEQPLLATVQDSPPW